MIEIERILGFAVDAVIADDISVRGQFTMGTGNNLWFEATMLCKDYTKIQGIDTDALNITGNIDGLGFNIEGAILGGCSRNMGGLIDVKFIPLAIVIGCDFTEKQTQINQLYFNVPELNWFYNSKIPLPLSSSSYEQPLIYALPITSINNENAKLAVTRGYTHNSDNNGEYFRYSNMIYIIFDKPMSIEEGIHEIAKVRLFFAFLADDYIALPTIVNLITAKCKEPKVLWINDAYIKLLDKKSYWFRVEYESLNGCFADVWKKWVTFWNNKRNHPIIDLFFEIITHKSSGVNYFLNLCQALEVYSGKHRKCETKQLFQNEKDNGTYPVEWNSIPLQVRFKDLFQLHRDVLPMRFIDLSGEISDVRNYYTHYGSNGKKKIERKHNDVRSAVNSHIEYLHILLLATIYNEMGIPKEKIKQALSKPYLSPTASTPERLFQGSNPEGFPF